MQTSLRETPTRLLSVGQRITLVPDACGSRDDTEEYPSRIEDLLDDAILVSMPMRQLSFVSIPLYSSVSVYFCRRGSRYYFRATVTSLARTPLPILKLALAGTVFKRERRNHVRVDVAVEPVQMVAVSDDPDSPEKPVPGLVLNISAGGLGLACPNPLPIGTRLHVVLQLPGSFSRFEVDAEVIQNYPQDAPKSNRWYVGAAYRDISERERDRIAAFALHQQQLLRRRGLR